MRNTFKKTILEWVKQANMKSLEWCSQTLLKTWTMLNMATPLTRLARQMSEQKKQKNSRYERGS